MQHATLPAHYAPALMDHDTSALAAPSIDQLIGFLSARQLVALRCIGVSDLRTGTWDADGETYLLATFIFSAD